MGERLSCHLPKEDNANYVTSFILTCSKNEETEE